MEWMKKMLLQQRNKQLRESRNSQSKSSE